MTNTKTITYLSNPVHLTYIWTDGDDNLRQKVKLMDLNENMKKNLFAFENYPVWNFDGSSTGQSSTYDSEVLISPIKVYPNCLLQKNDDNSNRFRNSLIILCECRLPDNSPHPTNYRSKAVSIFNKISSNGNETIEQLYKPLYGIEQEFFVIDRSTNFPVDYNPSGEQKKYYCGVDNKLNNLIDTILFKSLQIGINVVGSNTEVAPGQAEIQLLSYGIDACDDLLLLRYVIIQIANQYNYDINFHPKVLDGDWNGSGAHVNFSTVFMRDPQTTHNISSYDHIMHAISQFEQNHQKHIAVYGKDNHKRLTGKHETSDMNTFSYGIANRSASIRIPRETNSNGYGYIEDRRPSSNFNPYLVLPLIFETSIIDLTI
jgi:glutamine synthetase